MHLLVDANTGTNKSEVSPALEPLINILAPQVGECGDGRLGLTICLTVSSHIHFSPLALITFSPISFHDSTTMLLQRETTAASERGDQVTSKTIYFVLRCFCQ